MSETDRRFFSAPSLAQAVAAAARHYGLDPAELDYHVRDRRHGFVKAPRGVVIEVDPATPRRSPGAPSAASAPLAAPIPAAAPPPHAAPRTAGARRPVREPERAPERRRERPRAAAAAGAEAETWAAPDADSELAAAEAAARLLRLAGLDLEARVARDAERIQVTLSGADEARLAELGRDFLDQLDQLMPRVVHGLCGRLVRVRVDGAGLRDERVRELRAMARAAAERLLAGDADEELLAAMSPAERRIVHMELAERAGIATESLGHGHLKRLRVYRT